MKNIILFAFCSLLWTQVYSQGHYPFDSANVWQYEETDLTTQWMIESRVMGRTKMPNGLTYTHLSRLGLGYEASYFRQAGDCVFAYNGYDSSEYKLYDFSAKIGDTISIYPPHNYSIVLISKDTINFYGRQLTRWVFNESGGAWFFTHYIIDSIGLSRFVVEPGATFELQGAIIKGIKYGIIVSVDQQEHFFPVNITLNQNYPNPFNPSTEISFTIPKRSYVSLKIFDIMGKQVASLVTEELSAGKYSKSWNAANLPSGVYFCKLQVGLHIETKKMILLR